MDERYVRNLGALTERECNLLRTKTVFVAGCGGLGGYLIEMLLRLGVGTIRAADGDAFEASNLNRQLLSSPSSLGQPKAEAAAARAALVNPDVRFEAIPEFVTEENAGRLIRGCDAVLDALLSPEAVEERIDRDENFFIVMLGGKPVGYFAWKMQNTALYLSDLYLKPEHRGKGYGKGLLKALARIAVARGCGRLEWWCLDWNKPSIDFYLSLGAEPMSDWTVYRITGQRLREMGES